MNGKAFWISAAAAVLSFAGGFLLANAINRSQIETIRAENERLRLEQSSKTAAASDLSLTPEEIAQTISEADRNAGNAVFQKNVGLALYRYASMKQDTAVLDESIRLLERAVSLDPKNYDLTVAIGNAFFDAGQMKKDNDSFTRSREFYQKALAQRPEDVEVRTDLGFTYFLQQPPDLPAAIVEFERSLKSDPKHEKTLLVMIQSLAKQNKNGEAAKYLEQLKRANPNNPSINELSSLLVQGTAVQ